MYVIATTRRKPIATGHAETLAVIDGVQCPPADPSLGEAPDGGLSRDGTFVILKGRSLTFDGRSRSPLHLLGDKVYRD